LWLLTSGGWGYLIIRIRMPEISDRISRLSRMLNRIIPEMDIPVLIPAIREIEPKRMNTADSKIADSPSGKPADKMLL
jgi:hypothetical protein